MGFGVFLAPHHPHNADPALQLRQDLKLIAELDDMGFDEVWVGEHHSNGSETIAAPDLMLAAAAEHTKHIALGTGVVSMSYHHPLVAAGRITQLDHMTRGRVIFGTGPGKLALDAHMMGIDPAVQRRRQQEALEAIIPLLNGETVDMETDWFTLRDATLHLLPYDGPGAIEVAAASVFSESGPTLCGTFGLSMLSLAAGTSQGFDALPRNWALYEQVAAEHGHVARRDRWRIMEPMFLAESRAEVERAVSRRMRYLAEYSAIFASPEDQHKWLESTPGQTLEHWRNEITPWGRGTFGPPEEAIERIELLREQTGGFGTFQILLHDVADFSATVRSFELFASEVIPYFKAHRNENRLKTLEFSKNNRAILSRAPVPTGAGEDQPASPGDWKSMVVTADRRAGG